MCLCLGGWWSFYVCARILCFVSRLGWNKKFLYFRFDEERSSCNFHIFGWHFAVCVCVRFGLYFAQIGMESLCFREQCFHIKVWSLKPNRALLFLPNAKNMGCSYKRYLSWRYLNSAIDNGGAGEARWTFTLAGKIEQVYTNQLTMKGTENCSTRTAPSLCSPAAKCHVMQFIGDILGDVRIVCWGFILVSWAFQFECVPNGFCCVCWIFTLVLRS